MPMLSKVHGTRHPGFDNKKTVKTTLSLIPAVAK